MTPKHTAKAVDAGYLSHSHSMEAVHPSAKGAQDWSAGLQPGESETAYETPALKGRRTDRPEIAALTPDRIPSKARKSP